MFKNLRRGEIGEALALREEENVTETPRDLEKSLLSNGS